MAKTPPVTRADGDVREPSADGLERFCDATSLPARLHREFGVPRRRGASAPGRAEVQ